MRENEEKQNLETKPKSKRKNEQTLVFREGKEERVQTQQTCEAQTLKYKNQDEPAVEMEHGTDAPPSYAVEAVPSAEQRGECLYATSGSYFFPCRGNGILEAGRSAGAGQIA